MSALLSFGAAVAADRVPAGRGATRAVARPDEDAMTLGVQAAGRALDGQPEPRALLFVSRTPPYEQGGCTQPLAELLGLQGACFTSELTAGDRDALAAVRLALALTAAGDGPVLVVAAHCDRDDARTGDGAVAALVGPGPGLAELAVAGSHVEELRDRWRLPGGAPIDADRSFVEAIGTTRLGESAWEELAERRPDPAAVVGPDPRAAAKLERALGGPGDPLAASIGHLGAAHALLRLVLAESATHVMALAGGQADTLHVAPTDAAAPVRQAVLDGIVAGARPVDRVASFTVPDDFDPYSSVPRSWRERGADLRLEGTLADPEHVPGRRPATGRVVTWTDDRVYPAAKSTVMAAVDLEGGGRFFGQVAAGESVAIGDEVELVPRRLHTGGGIVQWFWKVAPCR